MRLKPGDGTRVPKTRYESTQYKLLIEQKETGQNSTEILARYPRCTIVAHSGLRESTHRDRESKRISGGNS